MLALHQAQEVRASVMQYLRDTFHFQDSELEAAFEALMQHPKEGLFKGPYVSLKLPFVTAANADDSPLEISPNFPPYAHQLKAFERLHFDKKNRQQILTLPSTKRPLQSRNLLDCNPVFQYNPTLK